MPPAFEPVGRVSSPRPFACELALVRVTEYGVEIRGPVALGRTNASAGRLDLQNDHVVRERPNGAWAFSKRIGFDLQITMLRGTYVVRLLVEWRDCAVKRTGNQLLAVLSKDGRRIGPAPRDGVRDPYKVRRGPRADPQRGNYFVGCGAVVRCHGCLRSEEYTVA